MSGTSADGVDAALVEISSHGKVAFIGGFQHEYPPNVRQSILNLYHSPTIDLPSLCTLNHQISTAFAEAADSLLLHCKVDSQAIAAIGSHGQTLAHQPLSVPPFTLQLSNPSLIAQLTGIDTVADFRQKDMALGGHGAPLVPAFHADVFAHCDAEIVLNLGGIANVTVLNQPEVLGFDTGPANTLLDAWCQKMTGQPFDANGDWARSGTVDPLWLQALCDDPYFSQNPPKSTGPDYFNLEWLASAPPPAGLRPQDVQATLTELTAASVTDAITQVCGEQTTTLLVCGGGAHNTYLLSRLTDRHSGSVELTSEHGVDCDYCEAIAFAWLAHRHLCGKPGNLPSVTGARNAAILGGLYPAG